MSRPTVSREPQRAGAVALLDASGLPTADLTDEHMRLFFHCGPAATPTALVGVELHGNDALLRSLVVETTQRSKGLGAALVTHAERFALGAGAQTMYLLTTTAESFFRRCGYETADRQTAPAGIRATKEFSELCPANSAFLLKHLRQAGPGRHRSPGTFGHG